MGIFDAVTALFHSDTKAEEHARQEETLRRAFKARCGHFKSLLSANKSALEAMATLEEALRGEQLYSLTFVRANCTRIITNVFNMVRHLNGLSGNAHTALFDRLKETQQHIAQTLTPKENATNGPLVLPLTQTGFHLAHEVGGKMASLGEAWQNLGQAIPAGFVVTASGYQHFLQANNLQEEINRRIQITDLSSLDAVFNLSASLQQLLTNAPVPDDLAQSILSHFAVLKQADPAIKLAVRSSAIGEDEQGASFAGQYRSELNVAENSLLTAYKSVVASKYSVTAMMYRFNRGIPDYEAPMCVGCLAMIDAASGGVAYSRDPIGTINTVVVNAVPGLPKTIVDGSSAADIFTISRDLPHTILTRHVPVKQSRFACSKDEGIVEIFLPCEQGKNPCLTDEQILEITKVSLGFEAFYGVPQDVEWAYTSTGQLIVLQTRALPKADAAGQIAPPPPGAVILHEGGIAASPGAGAGPVFLVRRDEDMLRFPTQAVLLTEQAHARWAPVLNRAAAIITEHGGAAGHLASVAREYGLPALFGVPKALELFHPGQEITVDATSCRVYQGKEEQILHSKPDPRDIFKGSPVHTLLAKVVQHIVPLHLLHPDAPTFAPEFCRTLHDITRYCHEKAVEEMFRVDATLFSERCGKQLKYKGGKLQYFVINIEHGFKEPVEGRYVDLNQIACAPMLALWEGMIALPWAGPPATNARGFLALVAESAGNPELEITSASTRMTRNYFMVDKDYCNLQASFGYHFCTVEAQAGENEQENYVSFHFKGGAANLSRRITRVQSIGDILAENGFIVDVKEDALAARAEELLAEEALELLAILGFLLIHTRQMDAGLHGDDPRALFADTLRKGIAATLQQHGSTGKKG